MKSVTKNDRKNREYPTSVSLLKYHKRNQLCSRKTRTPLHVHNPVPFFSLTFSIHVLIVLARELEFILGRGDLYRYPRTSHFSFVSEPGKPHFGCFCT